MNAGPMTGQHFGAYRLDAQIGRGGMGIVYRAVHEHLGRTVALKLLTPQLAADPDFRERFLRESRLAASVDHPGIVTVYDAGDVGGTLYIAMRFVQGTDLAAVLHQEGRLDPERTLALLGQVASALDAAHTHQLVHRDVKPANVMVEGNRCYLTDFGLTKPFASKTALTATGQFLGTADYVAPEQVQGGRIDGRADVYALGCMLYECLTGARPFPRDAQVAVLYAHLRDPPPRVTVLRPDLPAGIDHVVATAMAKLPEQRYGTCIDLINAARAVLIARPQPATAALPTPTEPSATAALPHQPIAGSQLATAPLPQPAPPTAPSPVRARPKRGGWIAGLVIAAVVAAAVVAGVVLTSGGSSSDDSSTRASSDTSSSSPPASGPRVTGAAIPVGGSPLGVTYSSGFVWVANSGDNSVTRVSPDGGESKTIDVGGGPSGISGAAGLVWVTNATDGTMDRIDASSGQVTLRLNLEDSPLYVAASITRVFATNNTSDSISEFYVPGGAPRRPPFPAGSSPRGIALTKGFVWVADSSDDTVSRLSHGIIRQRIGVGRTPVAVAAGNNAVWVANKADDSVSRIDAADPSADVQSVSVGSKPVALTVGEGFVWVANSGDNTVQRLDPKNGERVGDPIQVPGRPAGVAVGAGSVWVTVNDRNELVRIAPR